MISKAFSIVTEEVLSLPKFKVITHPIVINIVQKSSGILDFKKLQLSPKSSDPVLGLIDDIQPEVEPELAEILKNRKSAL